jgi:hypothetical protein
MTELPDLNYCNSYQRPRAVLAWAELHLLTGSPGFGPAFWRLVADEWSGFDAIPHDDFAEMFSALCHAHSWELMPEADREFFNALPEAVTVYRGGNADTVAEGLSWTLDEKVAAGFARGHRGMLNKCPVILRGIVRKVDVALAVTDRSESEIVVFSPEDVEVM